MQCRVFATTRQPHGNNATAIKSTATPTTQVRSKCNALLFANECRLTIIVLLGGVFREGLRKREQTCRHKLLFVSMRNDCCCANDHVVPRTIYLFASPHLASNHESALFPLFSLHAMRRRFFWSHSPHPCFFFSPKMSARRCASF